MIQLMIWTVAFWFAISAFKIGHGSFTIFMMSNYAPANPIQVPPKRNMHMHKISNWFTVGVDSLGIITFQRQRIQSSELGSKIEEFRARFPGAWALLEIDERCLMGTVMPVLSEVERVGCSKLVFFAEWQPRVK